MRIEPLDKKVGLFYIIRDNHGMMSDSTHGLVHDTVVGILRVGPYDTPPEHRSIFPIHHPGYDGNTAYLTFEEDTAHITPAEFRKRFFQKRLPWMFRDSPANSTSDGRIFERVIENMPTGTKKGYHLCSAAVSLEFASQLTTTLRQGHFFYIDLETAKAIQKEYRKRRAKKPVTLSKEFLKDIERQRSLLSRRKIEPMYGPHGFNIGVNLDCDPVILDFVVDSLEWHTIYLRRIKEKLWKEAGKKMVFG